MTNANIFNLGQRAVSAALTDEVITEGSAIGGGTQALVDRLEGMTAITLVAKLAIGTLGTGTAVKITVQTRLGSGGDWIDIAEFDFTTSSALKVANLSGLLSKAVATDPALSSEGVVDGVLGDALRAIVTSTGVYGANCNVSVTAAVR